VSKFYLPTQKGTQLFPTTVVAPPIVRWVGVDPRTADGQAILDTFGSAITAFHMQQAHNHSLSVNTQSRGFVQLAPNLGVQYVNQGGAEYITIYAQLAPPVEEKKPEVEKPVTPVACWFPENGVHGMLTDMFPSLALDISPARSLVYQPEYYGWQFLSTPGTVPLNFDIPLVVKGQSYTEIGISDLYEITFGGTAFPTSVVDGSVGFPQSSPSVSYTFGSPRFTLIGGPAIGRTPDSQTFVGLVTSSVRMGYGSEQFGGTRRKCVVIEWVTSNAFETSVPENTTYTQTRTCQLILVEALHRDGRPTCPAMIGFSARFDQVSNYGPYNTSYGLAASLYPRYIPANTSSNDSSGYLGTLAPPWLGSTPPVSGSSILCTAGTVEPLLELDFDFGGGELNQYDEWDLANGPTIVWVALDPSTGELSSLRPAEEWVNF